MDYRPEIDGLRALAVVPVVLFHANLPGVPGGFVGVDVFFVISGYLITSIILTDLDAGRFCLADFYRRRMHRILPALLVMCVLTLPVAFLLYSPAELRDFSQSLIGVATFSSNVLFWLESGYFDTAAEMKPLLHTWSLAVEEQFYLVFPLLTMLLWPVGRFGYVAVGLVLAGASFAVALAWAGSAPMAAFYLLPARGWELLLGASCACLLLWRRPRLPGWAEDAAGLFGIAMILAAVLLFDETTVMPVPATLVPTAGAALIVLFARAGTPARWVLSRKPLVGVGLVSYSLYLWHQPIFAFLKRVSHGAQDGTLVALALVVSFGLAWLSWRLIEQPWRRPGIAVARTAALGVPVVALLAIGVAGHVNKGLVTPRLSDELRTYSAALGDTQFPVGLQSIDADGSYGSTTSRPYEILFFGDSHAEQYLPRLMALHEDGRLRPTRYLTGGGCPPVPGVTEVHHPHCDGITDRMRNILDATPSIHTVVIGACFACYFIEDAFTRPLALDDYEYVYVDKDARHSFLSDGGRELALARFVEFIADLARHKRVLVILDNPASDNFDPGLMLASRLEAWNPYLARRFPELSFDSFELDPAQRSLSGRLAAALSGTGAEVFDPSPVVCPGQSCSAFHANGQPIYKDAHHMRPFLVASTFKALDAYFATDP